MGRVILRIIPVLFLLASAGIAAKFSSSQDSPASGEVEVISAVAPLYPVIIRGTLGAIDVRTEVSVEMKVDRSGTVTAARSVSGHPILRVPAARAARQWKFASCDMCEEVRTVHLSFIFRTMPRGTPEEEMTPIFGPPYRVEVRRYSVKAKPNNSMQRTRN